jgi:hypothetical protein
MAGARLAIDVTPIPWVSLNLSAGTAFDGAAQYAAMTRVRVARASVTGGIGGGVSAGKFIVKTQDFCLPFALCPTELGTDWILREWSTAYWANAEAFIEGRLPVGLQWRAYAGVGRTLNPNDSDCQFRTYNGQAPRLCQEAFVLGYIGGAIGYHFSLW